MIRARTALVLLALTLTGAVCLLAPAPASAQKSGGTLTIVRPTDPVSLDPQPRDHGPRRVGVLQHARARSLTIDEKMQLRSPRWRPRTRCMSPTKVRFKLRPGVKFHDGTPFNAAAVKFTFDRALQRHPAGALGEPGRLALPRRGGGRPHGGRVDARSPTARSSAPSPCTSRASSRPPPCRRWARTSAARPSAPGRSASSSGRPIPT